MIPFAIVRRVYDMARHASLPGGATMAAKREAAIGWYRQHGATDAQVRAILGRTGTDDTTVDDLISASRGRSRTDIGGTADAKRSPAIGLPLTLAV